MTLREIAEQTGLSKPTVTRILGRDAHRFSPKTRKLVFETAAKLGYRVNTAAKAMTSGRFGCVTLVMGYDAGRSDVPAGLLMGIQDELMSRDLHLAVSRLPDEKLTNEGFVPKVLRESMSDGMLINYTHDIPERMIELIHAHHAPAIWINTKLPSDCVYPDDFGGTKLLTQHLLSLGHRRLAYLKFDAGNHYSTADRRDGFSSVMIDAGFLPQVVSQPVPLEQQVELVRSMLSSPDRPTGLIVRPEDAATVFMVAASLGLEIPRDLSVASIAGALPLVAGRRVTSAIVPSREEGQTAVRLICEKIRQPMQPLAAVAVPMQLSIGDSCREPLD